MWRLEAERSANGARDVRLRSGSEEAECDVAVGQEARAASAAGDGSPRGPGVLARGAFLRERSSARSCGIDPCRAEKRRRGNTFLGLGRGGGARKAPEVGQFSGDAFR
jgi:hypothetical protein